MKLLILVAAALFAFSGTLVAGSAAMMPDVRHLIEQCARKDVPGAACGVYYADLRGRND